MRTFDHVFLAPDPGTYWTHGHAKSWKQAARDLAGPLIVKDTEPSEQLEGAATKESVPLPGEWPQKEDGILQEVSFDADPIQTQTRPVRPLSMTR